VTLAVGFAPHTGWSIAVVIDGRTVVDRLRIDIAPSSVDRQVFHAAEGRRDGAAIVERGVAEAHEAARRAVAAFDVASAGIVGLPLELPEVDRILANHRLMHAAEGDLYRVTLADACAARGWPVEWAAAKDLEVEADGWKGAATSPWTKDHRLAAAVALRSVEP
jgi:hypothetical protein